MDEPNITEITLEEALAGIEKLSGCSMCDLHEVREAHKNEVIEEYTSRIIELRISAEDVAQEHKKEMSLRARHISYLYMSLLAVALFAGWLAYKSFH